MTRSLLDSLRGRLDRGTNVYVRAVELPGEGPAALELEARLCAADTLADRGRPGLLEDRIRSLVARAALRSLIGELTGSDPLTVSLRRDQHGRLVPSGHPELRASVSHSGRLVLCAVAGTELGVDVEPNDRSEADALLAGRVCTSQERRWLYTVEPQLRRAALTRLWVRKEALAKALGVGLALPMAGVDVRRAVPTFDGVADRTWSLCDLGLRGGYSAAVAARGAPAAVQLTHLLSSALPGGRATSAHGSRSAASR